MNVMNRHGLHRVSENEWVLPRRDEMLVDGVVFASTAQLETMEDRVFEQLAGMASLPGVTRRAFAMPDAHQGYGFPIGGVAAMDRKRGGVVSAGGVGFDIACGVRTHLTGLHVEDVRPRQQELADRLFAAVPSGVGVGGSLRLADADLDDMLAGGAHWAVREGFGISGDLDRIEDRGRFPDALPSAVSGTARKRQRDQMGTLGSGNHYLEVQVVEEIFDEKAADAFELRPGDVVVSIHCGSRGLGHQVATDYVAAFLKAAPKHGLVLPDRELACAPIDSHLGREYLGAMHAAANCALANRQIIGHFVRNVFETMFGGLVPAGLPLLYDVSHNTCREEEHRVGRLSRRLHVHRKGATRVLGPGHPALPGEFSVAGQPVLIGGSMGTASYVLAGTSDGEARSFSSTCHGAGRLLSRTQARKRCKGRKLADELERRGILIRTGSFRGISEEAPDAYKNIDEVAAVSDALGLARKVARLSPLVCIKG